MGSNEGKSLGCESDLIWFVCCRFAFGFSGPPLFVLYLRVFVLFASRIALGNCQKQKNEIKMKMKKTHEDEHEQHEKKTNTISSPWLPEMNIT